MGASRSLPIWYPLSLNCWPKGLNFGQASWHDEHGMPYLRAKAGIALAGRQSTNARTSNRNMLNRIELARMPLPIKLVSFDNSIRPSSYGQIQIQIFWGVPVYRIERARRPTSVLLHHTAFMTLEKRVNERVIRGRWELCGKGPAHRTAAKPWVSGMREHRDFPSTTESPFRKGSTGAERKTVIKLSRLGVFEGEQPKAPKLQF